MPKAFRKSIILSAILHILILIAVSIVPTARFKTYEKSTTIVWVDIPKGTSTEIGLGIRKSKDLPKSTIEEQKQIGPPNETSNNTTQKSGTRNVAGTQNNNKMTGPVTKASKNVKKTKKVSPTDKKIANALAMLDNGGEHISTPVEAAQISGESEGYIYGTGTKPLKVLPDNPEYIKYQAMVRAKIIEQWVIPLKYLEEESPHFKCSLEVMINMDGEVITTSWMEKSDNESFDASALRAVKKASPLPKPSDKLAWEAYNEGFLIEFDPRMKN